MLITTKHKRPVFRIGAHMSIAGGLPAAVDRAVAGGFNCLQIFTHSPRVWAARAVDQEEIRAFKRTRAAHGIKPVIVHAPYLPNLASHDDGLWQRSLDAVRTDYSIAGAIGADYYVIHPGSTCGLDTAYGIHRIVKGICAMLACVSARTTVLLETTAGGGSSIGASFSELATIISLVREKNPGARMGICIDTAHVFAAGFDIRTPAGLQMCLDTIRATIGLRAVKVIHANDSATACGSRRDHHAHIGTGTIGRAGFRNCMAVPWLRRIPWILETPKEPDGSDVRNRKALERLFRLS